jgi:hypothetical protein
VRRGHVGGLRVLNEGEILGVFMGGLKAGNPRKAHRT